MPSRQLTGFKTRQQKQRGEEAERCSSSSGSQADDSGVAVTERCCKNQRHKENAQSLRAATHSSTQSRSPPRDPSPERSLWVCSRAPRKHTSPAVGRRGLRAVKAAERPRGNPQESTYVRKSSAWSHDTHFAPSSTAAARTAQTQDGTQETGKYFHWLQGANNQDTSVLMHTSVWLLTFCSL